MAEKLSSPRQAASGSPAGPPKQARAVVPLPVLPPPEPSKKLISPRPVPLPVLPVPEPSKKLISPPPKELPAPPPTGRKIPAGDKLRSPVGGRRVAVISDISRTAWRDELLPAHFDNCQFHVESGSQEGGRRIVVHEFPKKDLCYSEDMGRSATTFTVRGYCIVYPRDTPNVPLFSRDYRVPRNTLQWRLDQGGGGTLQLPTFRPMRVVCQRYRMSEEAKFGGYVVFDMQFVELGAPPFRREEDTETNMIQQSQLIKNNMLLNLSRPHMPRSSVPRPVLPATGEPIPQAPRPAPRQLQLTQRIGRSDEQA